MYFILIFFKILVVFSVLIFLKICQVLLSFLSNFSIGAFQITISKEERLVSSEVCGPSQTATLRMKTNHLKLSQGKDRLSRRKTENDNDNIMCILALCLTSMQALFIMSFLSPDLGFLLFHLKKQRTSKNSNDKG